MPSKRKLPGHGHTAKKKTDVPVTKPPDFLMEQKLSDKSVSSKLSQKMADATAEPRVADIEDWSPPHWQQTLHNVRLMRTDRDAPVDSLGAETFMKDSHVSDEKVRRFHVLVSLMLSSQTKDEVNFAAMTRLKQSPTGLTVQTLLDMPHDVLAELIKPVGFWRRKTEYLQRAAQILRDEYAGDIPASVEQLCSLPGVGPKMAHICASVAWGRVSGIGVDTHVHRISNRLGWVCRPTATPDATRAALQSWLPRQHWSEINLLLVGFGQQRCKPVAPRCDGCLNYSICPAAASSKARSVSPRKGVIPAKKTKR